MSEVLLQRIDGEVESTATFGIGALETRCGNLPMCGLGYHTTIRGLSVRTEITQTFYNPFDQPIEATYIFPIEGTMAVIECLMLVEDRIIRADLQERAIARQRYRDAIRRGHRAALLEENRSETFSLSVGNIPSGEAIRVRMITVGQLPVVNSVWTLRLPLVVAPRYTSGVEIPGRPIGPGTVSDTDEVPDASHVTPPLLLPGAKSAVELRLSVEIDLAALKPEQEWHEHLASSLHAVVVDGNKNRCRVQIKPGNRIDRDFILRGAVASQKLTTVARLEPPVANQLGTFAIDIVPPQMVASEKPGRAVVFVLDRSGSMNGWKYTAAQRGVARLIDSLQERDRFGVILFDNQQLFFVDPVRKSGMDSYRELAMVGARLVGATDKNRFAAIKWLNNIKANGGTEMAPAIELALDMVALDRQPQSKASIVLITDGQITGEDYVLSRLNAIAAERRPRIYTLGVDRAVNASVLRRLSETTGGTFELVESESQLDKSIKTMSLEIGAPVLTDIRVLSDEEHELAVGSADLYAHRPVSIFGRTKQPELTVRLVALNANGEPWEQDVQIQANGHAGSGTLISLWGKGRVRMLEDQYAIDGRDDEAARQKIVETSLESRVLSRFTAYVAVDEMEIVNRSGSVNRVAQPVELPEGWEFGRLPVIPAELRIRIDRPITGSRPFATDRCSAHRWHAVHVEQVGQQLIRDKKLSKQQWDDSQKQSAESGRNAIEQAISTGYVFDDDVAKAAAKVARTPFIDLNTALVPENVVELVPEIVVRENMILPVGEDGANLVIATCNPWDIDAAEKLRSILNRNLSMVTCAKEPLLNAINELYGQFSGVSADSSLQEFADTAMDLLATRDDSFDAFPASPGRMMRSTTTRKAGSMRPLDRSVGSKKQRPEGDAPNAASSVVVPLLKLIFAEADLLRASMVVFQKASESVVIQFLIDGVWHERDRVPLRHWRPIVEYLKSLAMKGNRRDEIWVGEFSRDNCKEFLASGSIGTRMEPSQSISIRIEGDERIEVQFSRQG